MCIIAYVPAGKQIKEETIRYMFKGNPDGAGIMWKPKDGAPIEIRKGFMKVEELIAAYSEIPVQCEKAIHCRIATSGKVSVACCHPFPVRAKTTAMREAVDSAPVALMHNGIISYTTPSKGMASDYSDTMLFASRILYPLQKQLNEAHIQTLIENSTSSRLLIFRQDGETLVFGDWKFEDGVYYSNGNYKVSNVYANLYGYGSGSYYGGYRPGYVWDSKARKYVDPKSLKNEKESEVKAIAPAKTASNELEIEENETETTFLADQNDIEYDDCTGGAFEDQLDGYDYNEIWLTVPDDCTKSDMEIENEILDALGMAGYDVYDMATEEYNSHGITQRSVWVAIDGQLPAEVNKIASYELE